MSVLNKRWNYVKFNDPKWSRRKAGNAGDDSIWTDDDEEVLGCSEWLRCDPETLQHIVDIHNAQLEKDK